MYWYVSNLKTRTCSIPYYTSGEQKEFNAQLVIEAGETFRSAYLSLIDKFFVGTVWAQILPDETWVPVGGVFDSTCFLGTLIGPTEICLRFRIVIEATKGTGEYAIPIQLFHGEALPGGPDYTFSGADDADSPLWGEEESDRPLWNGHEGEAPYWESGSMCGKKEYLYLPPAETLSKGDPVAVDTDGTTEAYLLAGCVDTEISPDDLGIEKQWIRAHANATLKEANCIGIIDDDCVNFEYASDGVVVTDGTSLYWQGGIVDSAMTGRVWQLDRLMRLWTELNADADGERSQHVGFYYDSKLFIWGGKDGSGNFLNTLLAFDLVDKTWSAVSSGGTARCQCGVILVGTEAHFVGGVDASGNVVRTVDIVNLDTLEWSTGAEAPAGFSSLGIDATTPVRPVWQVCDDVLFYGGPTAGRDEQFWEYNGVWTAPSAVADNVAPGRDVLPNVPLKPAYSLPQHCARIKAFGTDGPGEWIGLPKEEGRLADLYNEDLGTFSELNIGERRALTDGFFTDSSLESLTNDQVWLGATEGTLTDSRPDAGWIQLLAEKISSQTICFRSTEPVYNITRWSNSSWTDDGVRYAYEFGGNDGTGITNRLRRLDLVSLEWTELTAGCTARSKAGFGFSAGKLYVVGGIDADGSTLLNTMCVYDTFAEAWEGPTEMAFPVGYDQEVISLGWPGGGFWAGEWETAMCYKLGSIVYNDGAFYRCTQTHVSAAVSEPESGAHWFNYWEEVTELPTVIIVGGTTDQGNVGDIWIYDPNDDTLTEGIGAGSDFRDDFNTNAADFSAAQEELIGAATLEDNWPCEWDNDLSAGLGSIIYTVGARRWSVGGEMIYFQRTLIAYSLVENTYSESYDLSGDYVYSEMNPDSLASLEHMFGYGRYLYAFGQYYDTVADDFRFGCFRINPEIMVCDLVAACRTGGQIEPGVNDRLGCSGTFSDGKVYFYGGHGPMAPQVDVFNLDTESFEVTIASGGERRSKHAATVYANQLYVYFGSNEEGFFLPSCIKLNLSTSEVTEWVVPGDYWGGGNDGKSSCTDDDGNLFIQGFLMFMPSTDTWIVNTEMIFDGDRLIYYGGALYWDVCSGTDISKYKADLGAGYIPLAITKNVVYNRDGTVTITYSTGEVYKTLITLVPSGHSRPVSDWLDYYNAGTGMTSLASEPVSREVDKTVVKTGYSTDDGGQVSVEHQYTLVRTSNGGQCVSYQVNYA